MHIQPTGGAQAAHAHQHLAGTKHQHAAGLDRHDASDRPAATSNTPNGAPKGQLVDVQA